MERHIGLPIVRKALNAISILGFVLVGIILRFDPPTAVWFAWGVSLIVLFDAGLYLRDFLPRYQAGTWILLGMVWFVGFLYAGQLADRLACPSVEYRGKLLASALPSPTNPCLGMKKELMEREPAGTIKPFPPDTVFLFLGSETNYIFTRGHWPIITNRGKILLSADFNETGLSVSTEIYTDEGILQATVTNNDVDALSPEICVKRPDLSTLIITDRDTKQERLYVHYLNPRAVEFRGSLHYPNLASVEILDNQIKIGGMTISGGCMPAMASKGMITIN